MPHSTIRVVRSDGTPIRGARVVLGFAFGHTHEALTDSDGTAEVQHETSGEAAIYVNGSRRGSLDAPDHAELTL